jgi:hypothetical protein
LLLVAVVLFLQFVYDEIASSLAAAVLGKDVFALDHVYNLNDSIKFHYFGGSGY